MAWGIGPIIPFNYNRLLEYKDEDIVRPFHSGTSYLHDPRTKKFLTIDRSVEAKRLLAKLEAIPGWRWYPVEEDPL
jgi:hypothetical protein